MVTKWLKDSGLVVNEGKTEICLFYKSDHPLIEIRINDILIKSKKTINVLGVLFDSKLQWCEQVSQAINKSKRAMHGIKLIRKYLTKSEMKMLLTSNFYSILYYNCEIWLSQGLHARQKQQLLSASATALKILNNVSDIRVNFTLLHKSEKRALPMNFAKYRLAIQLFKIYNDVTRGSDWMDMNFQQNFSMRSRTFHVNDNSNLRIGKNILANRMMMLNKLIDLDWLNLSLNTFKLKVKELFLMN